MVAITQGDSAGREAGSNARQPGNTTRSRRDFPQLADRFRLPVVDPYRYYVAQGGLLSYGVNNVDLFRQAAPYIDRILRGAKPCDLPVQQPTRFQLVINAKTAKALNLAVSQSLQASADEVIE